MKTDDTPEIIEIIDDDTDAFGPRVANQTIHDAGGPRWIGPVAAIALVALIGYGVATSASTNDASKATPVTSTTQTPATTVAVTTTTEPARAVPYYALDVPPEFTLAYAEDLSGADISFDSGPYQLWGTPDATSTSGSWFSITEDTFADGQIYADNAYRTLVGDVPVAVSRAANGQTTAQFMADNGTAVTINSYGWDDLQLARLVGSVQAGGGLVSFTDNWFMDDHRLISTLHPDEVIRGKPQTQLSYRSSDGGASRYLGLSVGRQLTADEGRYVLDRATALRFFLDHITPFEVDGHTAIAGTLPGSDGYAVASWADGDATIVVDGFTSIAQLINVARTVHEVSAEEWKTIERYALELNTYPADGSGGSYEPGPALDVSSGTDADNKSWMISAMIFSHSDPDGNVLREISWQSGNNGWGGPAVDEHVHIISHADANRTYITADLPRAVDARAELRVVRDGLEPVVVPFNDVDPTLDRTLAAYAFSEPVPFTAEITTPDGTVLATWPTP
jgi:hypothetical protein